MRELPGDYSPKFPQVTLFKDREIQTIKELYDAAKRNGDHNVIVSLSEQIKKVTEIATETKPIEFVDMVIRIIIIIRSRRRTGVVGGRADSSLKFSPKLN